MYRIYERPQDRLKQMLLWRFGRTYGREFWALRDVSFDVERGETVGIIGRNGSGKSTLLQLIAGTLAPTTGDVQVQGRIAALLELGSGFNPEFTGRENVFMNGAILGLTQDEIEHLYETIVAFADIGDFIDQPIKVYSSGMVVRLAFAVQAHIQPDILIVDEALSVGDAYFQHKCMRHIKRLVDDGTTLLFVSHSSETVKRLCRRGIWLDSGEMRYLGAAGVAVERYLAFLRMNEEPGLSFTNASDSVDSDALEAPPALEPHLLPNISGTINLSDERLFVRGIWAEAPLLDGLMIRTCTQPNGMIAFQFDGAQLDLQFLRAPESAAVVVAIDGQERLIDLKYPIGRQIETVRLSVSRGRHIVVIRPAAHHAPGAALYWLGGTISTPAALTFRRDTHLALQSSEVERYGSGKARITAVELLDYATEQAVDELVYNQHVRLRIHAERLLDAGPRLEFSFIIRDKNRIDLLGTTSIDEGIRLDPAATRFVCEFSFVNHLGPGSYSVLAAFVECSEDLSRRVPMDQIDIALVFSVAFNPERPVWYIYHEPARVQATVEHIVPGVVSLS
jgi:ABC-type polysaccharide/polyol phosphate transport system ATPase subunit